MQQQSLDLPQSHHKNRVPVALHQDLILNTCELLLNQHSDTLPDLSQVSILLSNANQVHQCNQVLLQSAKSRGHNALLGPYIGTLANWLELNAPIEPTAISEHARELLLVEALSEYPHIYGQGSPWMLADSLMDLFDDLTNYHIDLPASQAAFTQQITAAYGHHQSDFSALSKESYLVHTLWTAIHQQLSNAGLVDQNTAHILKLAASITQLSDDHTIYYCGLPPTTPAYQQWQQTLLKKNQLYVISHDPDSINTTHVTSTNVDTNSIDTTSSDTVSSDTIPDKNAYHHYLQQVYAYQQNTFITRARQCKQEYSNSPIEPFIKVYSASDAEDEALAIDIQVRRWLIGGKKNIGIVTENRKLARRIRALLERANISLDDNSGWALSTTSAATVIERWLETVEEDFHHVPLLDFLKSPFLQLTEDNNAFLKTIYHFEQSIVINENIASGLERYLTNINFRQQRLPSELAQQYDPITAVLKQLAQTSKPLTQLFGNEHHPSRFIDGLLESLQQCHIIQRLDEDDAGQQLLQEIHQMKQAAHYSDIKIDWLAFRNWLGQTLERFNFKPRHDADNVKLVTLTSSELYTFDGLIFASAEQDHFPPRSKQSPFFNDAVRSALGIPTSQEKSHLNFYYYRRLLASISSTPHNLAAILFTRRIKENDEDIIPSPWLEALLSFHQFTHGTTLDNKELAYCIEAPNAHIIKDITPLPEPIMANPSVIVTNPLIPNVLSASAYQQLLNCPYQFFVARCLKLSPPESVREFLQKSDYGERIHLCLQAFHSKVEGLPGPVSSPINPENRQEAEALLNEIAQVVFSKDIEDNFLHRGWLKRWQTSIPSYIDWQIKHQEKWQVTDVEIDISGARLDSLTKISGRIDRIDSGTDSQTIALNVIDYKTGRLPSKEDVESGEAIQLPFYLSLLEASQYRFFNKSCDNPTVGDPKPAEKIVNVEYLDLSEPKVMSRLQFETESILTLKYQSEVRLQNIVSGMHHGEKLSAWGDSNTCRYCQMEGLCRKQVWSESPSKP